LLTPEAYAVIEGRHSDPFRYPARTSRTAHPWSVFSFPMRRGLAVIDEQGHESDLQRIHDAGLFEGRLRNGSQHYRLRARYGERQVEIEDPYRFPPVLSDFDLYLLGEGTHMNLYDKLGAIPWCLTAWKVWALRSLRLRPSGSAWSATSIFGMDVGMPCACAATGFGRSSCPKPSPGTGLLVKIEPVK
jgi:alpha-1,4-glucan branching enzyme GlgB, N-terminal domain